MFTGIPHLLLVEGEPLLAEITQFRLELLGYSVSHVPDAEEALTFLRKTTPNLIVVNQMLSGLDGIELVNRLSNDEQFSDLPVMVLSSNADLDNVQRAYNAGADDYLVTPYDPAILEAKVCTLLSIAAESD